MVKVKKNKLNSSKKNKKNIRTKNRRRNSKKKSKRRLQKGGKWGSWEGASTMNHPFANVLYNRFVRAPFLTEMGDLSPYV